MSYLELGRYFECDRDETSVTVSSQHLLFSSSNNTVCKSLQNLDYIKGETLQDRVYGYLFGPTRGQERFLDVERIVTDLMTRNFQYEN